MSTEDCIFFIQQKYSNLRRKEFKLRSRNIRYIIRTGDEMIVVTSVLGNSKHISTFFQILSMTQSLLTSNHTYQVLKLGLGQRQYCRIDKLALERCNNCSNVAHTIMSFYLDNWLFYLYTLCFIWDLAFIWLFCEFREECFFLSPN